jgi:hypothetical protein
MSFANAPKLSFAMVRSGERCPNPGWSFMTIAEGRNRYRQMIEDAVTEARARQGNTAERAR